MAKEIEKKFLVINDDWRAQAQPGARLEQAYMLMGEYRSARVRITGELAWLTLKFGATGLTRDEFEYSVPVDDAREMLSLRIGNVIDKTRFHVVYDGMLWEVDEFHGALAGLVIAEVEMETESDEFAHPPWVGEDVTSVDTYYNLTLALNGLPGS